MEIPIAENPRKMMKKIENVEEETLPEDVILLKILPHIPVKSALRLQLVSKQWRNFIKHSFYRRLQFSVTKNRNPSTFLILGKPELDKSVSPKSIAVDRWAKTIGPGGSKYALFSKSSGYAYGGLFFNSDVIWVCDGVFCVMHGADAALWNPAIREVRVLRNGCSGGIGMGFRNWYTLKYIGFGSVKDEWGNIVNFKLLGTIGDFENGRSFFVYSLNTDTWRVVESLSFRVNLIAKKSLVNLNGVLHLLAWGDYTKESAFLLTFDIVNETLGRIELPCELSVLLQMESDHFLTVVDDQHLLLTAVVKQGKETWLDTWTLLNDGNNKKSWTRSEKKIGPLRITGKILACLDGVAVIAQNGKRLCLHSEGKVSNYETEISGNMICLEYVESFVSPQRISDQDIFQDID